MYLEQLINLYYNGFKKYSGVDRSLLKKDKEFQTMTSEFGQIIKLAMAQDKEGKFKNNFLDVINEFNSSPNNKKMDIPNEDKLKEFLNPDADRIYRYRSFYVNALLKDKKLAEDFDKALPLAGINLSYLENVEIQKFVEKNEARYNNKVELIERDLDNYDDEFLSHGKDIYKDKNERKTRLSGIESLKKENEKYLDPNNPIDRKKLIEKNMQFFVEKNLTFSEDLTNRAKTAYNLIFNISDKNINGDELTAENLDLALTTISNLKDNHNNRPLWQRFFGYFGKIGNELKEADELAKKLAARYGLDAAQVNKAINGNSKEQIEARDALRSSKNLDIDYGKIESISKPNDNLKEYDINGNLVYDEQKKTIVLNSEKTQTKSFNNEVKFSKEDKKELDNIVNEINIDNAFDMVEQYEFDEKDFFIEKAGNDLDLEDDEEQLGIEKKIATFDKQFAKDKGFIDKFEPYEISTKVYSRSEVKQGKLDIKELKDNYKANIMESPEMEINLKMEAEFSRMDDGTEIKPIPKDSIERNNMLHIMLENATLEQNGDISEQKQINDIEIESPSKDK